MVMRMQLHEQLPKLQIRESSQPAKLSKTDSGQPCDERYANTAFWASDDIRGAGLGSVPGFLQASTGAAVGGEHDMLAQPGSTVRYLPVLVGAHESQVYGWVVGMVMIVLKHDECSLLQPVAAWHVQGSIACILYCIWCKCKSVHSHVITYTDVQAEALSTARNALVDAVAKLDQHDMHDLATEFDDSSMREGHLSQWLLPLHNGQATDGVPATPLDHQVSVGATVNHPDSLMIYIERVHVNGVGACCMRN